MGSDKLRTHLTPVAIFFSISRRQVLVFTFDSFSPRRHSGEGLQSVRKKIFTQFIKGSGAHIRRFMTTTTSAKCFREYCRMFFNGSSSDAEGMGALKWPLSHRINKRRAPSAGAPSPPSTLSSSGEPAPAYSRTQHFGGIATPPTLFRPTTTTT